MNKYRVALTRSYIVEINAKNKEKAKQFVEYFISGGLDASTKNDRIQYQFEIEKIKPTINDAFEVEKI